MLHSSMEKTGLPIRKETVPEKFVKQSNVRQFNEFIIQLGGCLSIGTQHLNYMCDINSLLDVDVNAVSKPSNMKVCISRRSHGETHRRYDPNSHLSHVPLDAPRESVMARDVMSMRDGRFDHGCSHGCQDLEPAIPVEGPCGTRNVGLWFIGARCPRQRFSVSDCLAFGRRAFRPYMCGRYCRHGVRQYLNCPPPTNVYSYVFFLTVVHCEMHGIHRSGVCVYFRVVTFALVLILAIVARYPGMKFSLPAQVAILIGVSVPWTVVL